MSTWAPTTSPTVSDDDSSPDVVTWVFFGLFLFLALTSRYLAKLVVALTKGLPLSKLLKAAIKRDLELPLFLGFVALFLHLALVTFLPVQGLWIEVPLRYIVRLISWIVIFIACVYGSRFLVTVIQLSMERMKAESYVTAGVTEFCGILRIIALAFIFLILLSTYAGDGSTALAFFTSINVISATLVVMFAPTIRALVAGLTLLSEKTFNTGQAIELHGIVPLGKLLTVRLRETRIRIFEDGSVVHIPNTLFMRYASINGFTTKNIEEGHERGVTVKASFPLSLNTRVETIRSLIVNAPEEFDMYVDDDYVLQVRRKNVPVDAKNSVDRYRTDMMMETMKRIHAQNIELRDP